MNSNSPLLKRLARILIVFLAGVILVINTACSQSPSAKANPSQGTDSIAKTADNRYPLDDMQSTHMKESYSKTEARPSSMNNYKDSEPGVDTAEGKANYLVEQAKKNLANRATNPQEAVDNLKETASLDKVGNKLNEFTDSVGRSAQETTKGAKKGFNNLQENVKSAADNVSQNIR